MDTRDVILKTALQLFARKGYESTGIQEITEAAGITKPTLYYYFGSKQGLLNAIVEIYGNPLAERARSAGTYQYDLKTVLSRLFREFISFAQENCDFWRLLMSLFSAAPETVCFAAGDALQKELAAILETLFNAASKDHGNMKNRAVLYAHSFLGLLTAWTLLEVNQEIKLTNHIQSQIIHFYMHGIFS